MPSRVIRPVLALAAFALFVTSAFSAPSISTNSSPEYAKHFDALGQLSVAVAEAMPSEKYSFRPHPDSMTFGELMSHIAATNY